MEKEKTSLGTDDAQIAFDMNGVALNCADEQEKGISSTDISQKSLQINEKESLYDSYKVQNDIELVSFHKEVMVHSNEQEILTDKGKILSHYKEEEELEMVNSEQVQVIIDKSQVAPSETKVKGSAKVNGSILKSHKFENHAQMNGKNLVSLVEDTCLTQEGDSTGLLKESSSTDSSDSSDSVTKPKRRKNRFQRFVSKLKSWTSNPAIK